MEGRKLRCQIGDLAWIIRSDLPENIGRVVRVVGVGDDAGEWCVEPASGRRIKGFNVFGIVREGGQVFVWDEALCPIRPDESHESPESIETGEPVEVAA